VCALIRCRLVPAPIQDLAVQPYERFLAWRACHAFNLAIATATDRWPRSERFELTAQIRRASWSAAANIVEGSAKRGPREFRRFLDISLGSLAEIGYGLRFARDRSLLTTEAYDHLEELRVQAAKLTWGLYEAVAGRCA
jgi:four helix bundle protein